MINITLKINEIDDNHIDDIVNYVISDDSGKGDK